MNPLRRSIKLAVAFFSIVTLPVLSTAHPHYQQASVNHVWANRRYLPPTKRARPTRQELHFGARLRAPVVRYADKIELLSVKSEKGGIEEVLDTKAYTGKEAQRILAVWNRQKLNRVSGSACHQPPYAIKMYRRGKLLLMASICWACRDVYFHHPDMKYLVEFDGESRAGQALEQMFHQAFLGEKAKTAAAEK